MEQPKENNSRKVSTNVLEQHNQNNSRKVSTNAEVKVSNANKDSGNKKRGSFFDLDSNISTKQKAELISNGVVTETVSVHNAPVVAGVSFSSNASKINDLFKMPKPAHKTNTHNQNVLENTSPIKPVTANNLFAGQQQPPQQPKLIEDVKTKEDKPVQPNNLFTDNNIISNTKNQQEPPKQPNLFDVPKSTNENISVNVEIKMNSNQLNNNNLFDLPQTVNVKAEAQDKKSVTNLFAEQLNAATKPKSNLFEQPAQEPQKQAKTLTFLNEPEPVKEEPKQQIQNKVKNLFGDDDDKPQSAFQDPSKDKRLKFLFDDD